MSELKFRNSLIKKTNLSSPLYHASVFVYRDEELLEQKSFGGSTPASVAKKMERFIKKYEPPKPKEPSGMQTMLPDDPDDLLF